MDVSPWVWAAFSTVVVVLLVVDVALFHRSDSPVSLREAGWWSAIWTGLGLGFGGLVWVWAGAKYGYQYFAGYVTEKGLSVDQVFLFALVLRTFAVPAAAGRRLVLLAVLAALAVKLPLVAIGAALAERGVDWILPPLGLVLVGAGVVMVRHHRAKPDVRTLLPVRLVGRLLPTTEGYRGRELVVRERGRRLATPLVGALVAVVATDLVFAVSVPLVFAATKDPFIVATSNVLATLGLRGLFFLVVALWERFERLKVGLAAILFLLGAELVLKPVLALPSWVAPTSVVVLLAWALAAARRRPQPAHALK